MVLCSDSFCTERIMLCAINVDDKFGSVTDNLCLPNVVQRKLVAWLERSTIGESEMIWVGTSSRGWCCHCRAVAEWYGLGNYMLPSSLRNAGGREHNYGDKMSKCPLLLVALRLCGVEIFTFYFRRAGLKLGSKKRSTGCWNMTAGICSYSDTRTSGIDVGRWGLAHSRHSNSSQMCSVGFRPGFCTGQSSSSPTETIKYFYPDLTLCTGEKTLFECLLWNLTYRMSLHALALRFGFTVITRLHKTF